MKAPTEDLKSQALSLGFQSAGVAPCRPAPHLAEYAEWLDKGYAGTMQYLRDHLALKESPEILLPGCRSVIAVTLNYNQAPPEEPKIARYALGRDYHKVLRGKLKRLAEWVEREHPGSHNRACVDSAPIFERDYAQLAGLGFFGKNTMLIDPKRGSWFFIGLLLTTVDFEPDDPFAGGCGTCRLCVDACPTGAIVHEDGRWQLDARKCISYLTIEHSGEIEPGLQQAMGEWTFGCDVCQEVCPFNQPREGQPQRAMPTIEPDLARRQFPKLEELAEISREEWHRVTAGSPLRRTGLEGLRRNAKINLQNKKKRGP